MFVLGFQIISQLPSDWPERSVLHNVENLQKRRQKRRYKGSPYMAHSELLKCLIFSFYYVLLTVP